MSAADRAGDPPEPEKRARAGRRRQAATDGKQGMFDAPALSSPAPHAQRQPKAQKSIFDSPVLSKRSTTTTTSAASAQAQRHSGAAMLKPNGRSVFTIPLQQPERGTDRAAGTEGKPRTATRKKGKKATTPAAFAAATVGAGSRGGDEHGPAPPTTTGAGGSWYRSATLQDILDELSSRFILHLPEEELASPERVCFQIEQAHWFYEDFIREEAPTLPTYRLKDFCKIFIAHCPLLSSQWGNDAASERAFERFLMYKKRVPVCGAIMLNQDWTKCVLVKGWKAGSSWGFPKGKMNNEEPKHLCAIREVEEETGYNCASLLNEQDYIQITMNDQEITLFVVTGVPEETEFKPQTRKEISAIEWFRLGELPTWSRKRIDQRPAKFFMIAPFVVPLKTWMRQMMDAAGTASDETDDVDQVVHIDPDHHEHDQHNQRALSPSIPPAAAAAQQEGITATTNGEPSVFDDLFSKFTLASEKNEVKHGAEQRQRADETRADPAMQELLGKLMMAREGRHDGPSSSSSAAAYESSQVDSNPLASAVDARATSSGIGDDSKQGKQQALMNKLMSSLGATPSKPSPSDYAPNNHPAPAPLPQNMQHAALLPSTPSKQSTVSMGIHGLEQSPKLHHPYSSINGAGLPVPTHNPALAALSGHAHPAITQQHFHGPLPAPHASAGPAAHGGHQPHPGPLSNVTSNLLDILTPPRPAGAAQFPHAANGNTVHHPPHGFSGTAMPDASAQNLGPTGQPVGHLPHPTMPYSNTQPPPLAQPRASLFGMHTSPQPPMAQTQNFASMPPPAAATAEHYTPNGPLPGPIQLPLHSGMPELNRILPYQMLPAHSIEASNGYPLHGHPAPPQFQQLHPAQMFSPPHQPASVVQAHPLLSLLNPRPNVPGIGSPPMTSAKTADGLLAMLVGNGRHEGGNG